MSHSEFRPTLLAALDRKFIADVHLTRIQQDMRAGIQVFSASAMLSALEDCDDAADALWLELGQIVREGVVADVQRDSVPSPIAQHAQSRTYTKISATQLLVRQFFVKRPMASPSSHRSVAQKQEAA